LSLSERPTLRSRIRWQSLPTPEARDHLAAGNRLYRLREFDKAVQEYKAGALLEDAPVFLYNLGQCYRQLGRYEDAIWHYERFIDRAKPSGEIKEAVDGFVKQMKDELQKKAMTQPPTDPADGKATPPPPKPITIVDRAEPWYADRFAWGLAGGGALAVGVSIGFLVGAKGLDDDANSETQAQLRDELHSRAHDRRVVAAVLGIAGSTVLATGIVKLAVTPSDRVRSVSALQLRLGPTGIAVAGRF